MSIVETIMETVAKVLPNKEVDPLIAHTGYVGQALQRVDGHAKVRGEARFTAEFKLDGLVYASLAHSTIAKGKIRKIDTEEAEHAPGVLEVVTYRNMPRIKAPPIVDFHNMGKGFALSDLPVMQNAEVHWDGEPVALVIACRIPGVGCLRCGDARGFFRGGEIQSRRPQGHHGRAAGN